ncbi:MAG: 5-methyltetrahydropteroyltriglutamate--homocysteine S-methyltransferase [Candidatus Eremiobacteraeota bacterium]|nr:5-methyltetrahydropteroyltriglutamate--homocysteine S-methyltransferase [Candidatus Eremiobacteraeota bacterium]
MAIVHTLGFPRIGSKRELKKALESFWKGDISAADLEQAGQRLREQHWRLQADAGLDYVSVGDFSYYDQVLDMTALAGAIPARYGFSGGSVDLQTYFAMARGSASAPAMEMTKWFDTNYHYIVPEFEAGMTFRVSTSKLVEESREALRLGFAPKPVLVGPLTFLWLGKERGGDGSFSRLQLLPGLLDVYAHVLRELKALGVAWVQLDEPALAVDLPAPWLAAFKSAYTALSKEAPNVLVATYFGSVADHAPLLRELPVAGVHLDLVRAPGQLEAFLTKLPPERVLSCGVVDGRNIWRTDLRRALELLQQVRAQTDNVWVGPSCSLMHTPVDIDLESKLDVELKSWLAFAKQKLRELAILGRGLEHDGREAIIDDLQLSDTVQRSREQSTRIHDAAVQTRLRDLRADDARRSTTFAARQRVQRERLRLPAFPTTTIGSFPQTPAIRDARAKFKKGELAPSAYEQAMQREIEHAVREQESLGLDVLVHGEAERNDMVEYFGEQLAGFAFTSNGWVQSYGSRYVKPPIIFGDVSRPAAMTVRWSTFAQSLTRKPMKGMLTGPVTILQWSFVRDDQPRSATATQIALAIRDEVQDLERAGIRIIQIDEPAFREGLPLKRADWPAYIDWAARAFRIASSAVDDATQVHTHMCYSEFNDIFEVLALLDADVITIESSRSGMELLDAFKKFRYPNEIGPGVYDIHSPRIPTEHEMLALLEKAADYLTADQLWVNPDCGLKTRRWEEVTPALRNMVDAARRMRDRVPVA